MISNISKRLIINSNKAIINSNRYLYTNSSGFCNNIINQKLNININNNFCNNDKNNNNLIIPKRYYVSNNNNNNNNNNNRKQDQQENQTDDQKEAFDIIYESFLKSAEETEKALKDDTKPSVPKKTQLQIVLSRHGTITFLVLWLTFLGIMLYFYFQKRKHILLSSQVEHHEISTIAECEKLKVDLSKLHSKLSTQSNQSQLVDLLITEIIESNNEALSKLSPKEINDLKLSLAQEISNYQKQFNSTQINKSN